MGWGLVDRGPMEWTGGPHQVTNSQRTISFHQVVLIRAYCGTA